MKSEDIKKRFDRWKKNAIVRNVFVFCLSLLGVFGVAKVFGTGIDESIFNKSLIPIILLVGIFYVYKKHVKKHNKSETVFEILFSVFLSVVFVLGAEIDVQSEIWWTFGSFAKILSLCFFVFPLINVLVSFISRVKTSNFSVMNRRKLFWITFGIIVIGGVLVWLATYPGVWGYDAATQFATVTNVDESLTKSVGAHYSLPLGGLMVAIMNFGNNVFGSYQAGLALCCFLQMLFMTYVATRITTYATYKTKNVYLYIIFLGFFALFPFYTVMTVYMTQDTIFGGFFALAFINLIEMVTNRDYWKKVRNPIMLAIIMLLLCLCRNNGFYGLAIAFVFALLFSKGKRLAVSVVFAVPMILYLIYNGPILSSLGVSTSSAISEILSVPSQQLARAYNYQNDSFEEADIEKLNEYYSGYNDFLEYRKYPSISDFTKRYIVREKTSGDLMGYIGYWLKIGLRAPKDYIEAFLINNIGFWYPAKSYPDERMAIPYFEYDMSDRGDDRFLVIERSSKIPFYDAMLRKVLVENTFVNVPILSVFCTLGFYTLLFLFTVGMIIVRKKWASLVPMGLVFGLFVTLLLSPVALFRYGFPIVILWPLFTMIIFEKKSGIFKKKDKNMIE